MRPSDFNSLMRLFGIPLRSMTPTQQRPCITCGKLKCHNNAFCSVGCKLVHDLDKMKAQEATGDE